jgi:hypothetical protein
MGDSSQVTLSATHQQRKYRVVHRDAAIAVTEHMAQNTHLKRVFKT